MMKKPGFKLQKGIIIPGFIIAITLTGGFTTPLEAQNEADEYKLQVGAAAGFSTGYGLSFRYWPANWGVQAAFGPYYDSDGPIISMGITGLRLIEDNGWSRFFFYVGNHLFINSIPEYSDMSSHYTIKTVTTYIFGMGPGLEFLIRRRLGINLMFGIAAYMNNDDQSQTNLTGETGIFYRF
ncbi:MAG: hypothetical protein JXA39_05955 [Bacteroidales bacterium]|nr:hypothetical protein [Bacteroidales bacterium]